LQNNPLFQEVVQQQERVYVADTSDVTSYSSLRSFVGCYSFLMVPVLYQGRLGMVELHHCGSAPHQWQEDEVALVEAIASQVGAALIQAEAYANLEALDRTRQPDCHHRSRTPLPFPLSVCLESLTEPDMPLELRQVMLNTALERADAETCSRFPHLSNLESGRVEWHLESLS